jgi:hypothetical protein
MRTTSVKIPSHARCRGCGYALRDLPEPRCPECGRTFDPSDPDTVYLGRLQYARTRVWPTLRALLAPRRMTLPRLAADAALAGLLATAYSRIDMRIASTAVGVMNVLLLAWLALVLLGAALMAVRPRWRDTPARWKHAQRWWVLSLILAAAALPPAMRTSGCPHASYYDFGWLGLAHSTKGGPCNNRYWRGPHIAGGWWVIYHH